MIFQYKDNTYKLVIPSIFEPKQTDEGRTINSLKQSIFKKFINDDSEAKDFEFKTNILVESLCPLEFEISL